MNQESMTLERLASFTDVDELVGFRPDRRWGRSCLTTVRSDAHSIASWFESHSAEERVDTVRAALLDGAPWEPLLRVEIPKRPNSVETRSIDMPVVRDAARLYVLQDWLAPHAETELTKVAAAYRRGVRMSQVVLNAHRRMQRLPFAAVLDVKAFYESLSWSMIDRVIGELPADEHVRDLLKALVRVEIVERRSGNRVEREGGIAQGLSISPTLANLAMNDFDRSVSHALSRLGVVIRRWCDDILLLCPTRDALQRALDIVQHRLAKLGLNVKSGTGMIADVRVEPVTWLGIEFGPLGLDVPDNIVEKKAAELQEELKLGIIASEGIDDALVSLDHHYRPIISEERSRKVIASIRGRLDVPNLPNDRKENTRQTRSLIEIRHTVDPRPTRANRGDSRTESTTGLEERTPSGDRIREPTPGTVGIVRTLAVPTAQSSGTNGPGAPARSAPAVVEKGLWRIGAVARGSRGATLVARQVGCELHERWEIDLPASESRPEAVLLALTDGMARLCERSANAVTVVVTDRTIVGYVWRGWQPRSLRMHRALAQLVGAAEGLALTFERARSGRKRGRP